MTSPAVRACPACGTRNRVPPAASGWPRCGRCRLALPWTADADDSSFDEVAGAAPGPVLVDLWAPWCGPCRTVTPVLDQLAVDLAGRCKLVKVDVDEAPATAARFGVRGVPTLLVLRGGAEVARRVGAAPEGELRAGLESSLGRAA